MRTKHFGYLVSLKARNNQCKEVDQNILTNCSLWSVFKSQM